MLAPPPQNYLFTSPATEMGRGRKAQKLDHLPEWTPGPGAYQQPTDFNKRTIQGKQPTVDGDDNDVAEQVARWDQRGYK